MSENQEHCALGSFSLLPAQPTFSLLFKVLVLIQEADVGLRAQRDVVLISSGFTATVLLLFLCSSLASSLQQLLELRGSTSVPQSQAQDPVGEGAQHPGGSEPRLLAFSGKGVVCTEAHVCLELRFT